MTLEERKESYNKLKEIQKEIIELDQKKKNHTSSGNLAFEEFKSIDREMAYDKGDTAGWRAAGECEEKLSVLRKQEKDLWILLEKQEFCFKDYKSTGAYGITLIKKVKVTFLDGKQESGLIYPWVYDNPQDYYLDTGKECIDLAKGWEIEKIDIVE